MNARRSTGGRRAATGIALAVSLFGCGNLPQGSATGTTDGGTKGDEVTALEAGARAGGDAGSGAFACVSSGPTADTVSVPAGAFNMGCASVDTQCRDDEKPQHTVTLSAFEIDKTEVTQDQYAACVASKACSPPECDWDCTKADYPATCVERAQAQSFCAWAGKRLPTEAEWEKAARGTDGRIYPWGNDAPDCSHANLAGCGDVAQPVGSHPNGASPYGALDMAGNVVEMVSDWYDATYYATSPASDPAGPSTGTTYGGRGGGYKSEAIWDRASSRDWYDLMDQSAPFGFRCAR
jgi:formylglycine-generating enzyme required for sulfatase activity